MVMRDAYIDKIDVANFREIPTEGIKAWFWTDSDTKIPFKGIHLEKHFPDSIPPFATHIWGWGDGQYIRIRVDHSLKSGFVAIKLAFSEGGSDSKKCVVQENESNSFSWGLGNLLVGATIFVARRNDNPATSVEFISLR